MPGRLMVGQRTLNPFIMVRIHTGQPRKPIVPTFCFLYNFHMSEEAILIHGWSPYLYNKNLEASPVESIGWQRSPDLLGRLSQDFDLSYYNLPGFCGVSEPKEAKYDVEDFANDFDVWLKSNGKTPKLIVGYSFGGAVALMHKVLTHDETPTVLISPAIFRGSSNKSNFANYSKRYIPESWEDRFRHYYQLAMSQYYREGTPFLRETYNTIARRDLRSQLSEVDSGSLCLIYGEKDLDTPWNIVREDVENSGASYHVIATGAHNVVQTHPDEIVRNISLFLHKNK